MDCLIDYSCVIESDTKDWLLACGIILMFISLTGGEFIINNIKFLGMNISTLTIPNFGKFSRALFSVVSLSFIGVFLVFPSPDSPVKVKGSIIFNETLPTGRIYIRFPLSRVPSEAIITENKFKFKEKDEVTPGLVNA